MSVEKNIWKEGQDYNSGRVTITPLQDTVVPVLLGISTRGLATVCRDNPEGIIAPAFDPSRIEPLKNFNHPLTLLFNGKLRTAYDYGQNEQ